MGPTVGADSAPVWLLQQQSLNISSSSASSANYSMADNNTDLVRQLQEELCVTKEHLLDQQTKYLQMQTKHRHEIDETTNAFNNLVKESQSILKQSLAQQRESYMRELRLLLEQQAAEYDHRLKQALKDLQLKQETELHAKLEVKFVELQESLENKLIKLVRDEQQNEKAKQKHTHELSEKNLKLDMEKHVQSLFKHQGEIFKEQIKSGIHQEHLIHKDLINSKLEKLFRASEEKRRETNLLFNRHLGGLNFFIENAHKQMNILNQAQADLLKNKEIIDYYGDKHVKADESPVDTMAKITQKTETPDECLLQDLA